MYDLLSDGPISERLCAAVVALAPSVGLTVDVGCGTGLVTRALVRAGHRPVGIDGERQMLLRLVRSGVAALPALGRVDALPLRPGCADVVVATNVVHLHPDPVRALNALTSVVARGGRLICSWPRGELGPFAVGVAEVRAGVAVPTAVARGLLRTVVGAVGRLSGVRRAPAEMLAAAATHVAWTRKFDLAQIDVPDAGQHIVVLDRPIH